MRHGLKSQDVMSYLLSKRPRPTASGGISQERQVGVKAPVKLGDFRSNRSRDIGLPHFVTNSDDNDNNDDAGQRTL